MIKVVISTIYYFYLLEWSLKKIIFYNACYVKRNICLKQRLNCITKISKFVCDIVNQIGVESSYLNNYLHTYMFCKLCWNAYRNFETACKNVILNVVKGQVQDYSMK